MKQIFKNLLKASGIILYFVVLIFAHMRMDTKKLIQDINVFSGAFLIIGILVIEKAYKKDDDKLALSGIELLVLSMHSLSIFHMSNLLKCDFKIYLIGSAVIATVYYLIKGIIISIKENKEHLNKIGDIAEIVKKDEPVKKEAKKRNEEAEIKETKEHKKISKKEVKDD